MLALVCVLVLGLEVTVLFLTALGLEILLLLRVLGFVIFFELPLVFGALIELLFPRVLGCVAELFPLVLGLEATAFPLVLGEEVVALLRVLGTLFLVIFHRCWHELFEVGNTCIAMWVSA